MNNINVGSTTLGQQKRGFYWPTTNFLINEEQKKRRSLRSPRRAKSLDEDPPTATSNRASFKREQFRKSSGKSQDSYFGQTVLEDPEPSTSRPQELLSSYSPSTLRRLCNVLTMQCTTPKSTRTKSISNEDSEKDEETIESVNTTTSQKSSKKTNKVWVMKRRHENTMTTNSWIFCERSSWDLGSSLRILDTKHGI